MKKMNTILNAFMSLMLVGGLMFITSCGDDEPIIDIGTGGIPVGDGMYIAAVGVDPASTAKLSSSTVDGPAFSALTREGFLQNYMFLTAGSYNMVEIASKEIVTTYGGTQEDVTEVNNAECTTSGYSLVAATVDGAAFTVATDGLYVIIYDKTLGEIAYDQIEVAGVIGGATPGGWGEDSQMTGAVTAAGGSWSIDDLLLNVNQMKFRFNCRWAIDRRLDTNNDFANDNGYSFFTNFGNTFSNLLPGNEGPNMEITERALYTVALTWNPSSGFSGSLTRTGDAEPLPEYPTELYMVGATIGGWDWAANGVQMTPVHSNPHLFWSIVYMDANATDPGIKFAPQKDWIGDFGITGDATAGVYAKGGDNVPSPATSGYYMVVANLDVGAETIEVNEPLVYGIGDAFGAWDAATADYLFTVDNPNSVIKFDSFNFDGNLRMHTTASTFTPVGDGPAVEWWQAEFTVLSNVIEYRAGGDDQTAVPVTAGQSVSLNFTDGSGSIQ